MDDNGNQTDSIEEKPPEPEPEKSKRSKKRKLPFTSVHDEFKRIEELYNRYNPSYLCQYYFSYIDRGNPIVVRNLRVIF